MLLALLRDFLLPTVTGTFVGCLVFLGAFYFSQRRQGRHVSLVDVLLLRRASRSAPPAPAAPEAGPYLQTPEEEVAYLKQAPERRRAPRRWGNPVEVRIISPTTAAPLRGVVINRSEGGLALLVDDPYEEGTLLKVHAVQAPDSITWLSVEVRNCRPVGKNWMIGCRYPQEPPWHAVVWFG